MRTVSLQLDHKLVRSLNNQRTPPNNHVFHRTTVRPKNNPSLRTDEKRTHDFDNIQLSNSWDTIFSFFSYSPGKRNHS